MGVLAFDQAFQTTGIAMFDNGNNLIRVGTFKTSSTYPDEVRIKQIKDMVTEYAIEYRQNNDELNI